MTEQSSETGSSTAVQKSRTMVGRQAIFDRQLEVYAYELLYRDGAKDTADIVDGDRATAQVMASTFVELGFEVVTGGKPAFINLTRGTITDEMAHLFPPERIVAEILEDVTADKEVLAHVRGLKEAGYTIVLDDFIFSEKNAALVKLADIIKLDVRAMSRTEIEDHVKRIQARGPKLLAEKVETHEEFEFCRKLGFDYFQGYFLCKPQIVSSKPQHKGHVGLLELITQINNPDSGVEEIEAAISKDAKLSYKLIRYINSAAFGLSVQVESIHHALMMLGRRLIRVWANMVILSGFSGKPTELLGTALMRGRMAESIARQLDREHPDVYFTAGLFSILDALLDTPMDKVLEDLPLGEGLQAALLEHEGEVGQVIEAVCRYERSDWEDIETVELSGEVLKTAYFEALRFVSRVLEINGEEGP